MERACRWPHPELVPWAPFAHRHGRAAAGLGRDLDLVHQPPCTPQSDAETRVRHVVITEDGGGIGDAGPLVTGDHEQAGPISLPDLADRDHALAGVDRDVASDLRDGRRHERGVRAGEAKAQGGGPAVLPGHDGIGVGGDIHPDLVHLGIGAGASSRRASPASRSSAVSTAPSCRPNWLIAVATSGWIPTTTVRAPRRRFVRATVLNDRATNESMTSRAATSTMMPRARCRATSASRA